MDGVGRTVVEEQIREQGSDPSAVISRCYLCESVLAPYALSHIPQPFCHEWMAQHWKDAVSNLEQIIGLVSFSQIPPPQVFLHFQFSKACDISSNLSGLDLRPTQYIYPICLNHLLVREGRDILRFRLVGLFSGWAVKYNPSEQIHSEISPSTRLVFSSSPWQAQDSSEPSIVHICSVFVFPSIR